MKEKKHRMYRIVIESKNKKQVKLAEKFILACLAEIELGIKGILILVDGFNEPIYAKVKNKN